MRTDIVDEIAIARMVEVFYVETRRDPLLGPVFDRAIGDAWPAHMATMGKFWSSVILTSGRYKGNPLAVHMGVPGLDPPMFGRWLQLFAATVTEQFEPLLAQAILAKAHRIAQSLQLALGLDSAPSARGAFRSSEAPSARYPASS
jgi:hemoglobin